MKRAALLIGSLGDNTVAKRADDRKLLAALNVAPDRVVSLAGANR
jgi:hypothetical protein